MLTSYFSKTKSFNTKLKSNIVSIARITPKGFTGRGYLDLAPPSDLVKAFKDLKIDKDEFIINYNELVLDKLSVHQVYQDLGENAILCCYGKSDSFCHRILVRDWFNSNGYHVEEYKDPKKSLNINEYI